MPPSCALFGGFAISAQLGAFPTTSPSYIWVRAIMWASGRGQTDRQTQTDKQTCVTTIHFAFALQHPRTVDEMELHTQQVRRFYRWRGESSPACAIYGTVCGVRWAMADYRRALQRISIVLP